MRDVVTHSQRLSITPRHLATENNFGNLKFMRVTSQSTGINVVETFYCSADRGQVSDYCAVQSTDYSVHCATALNSIVHYY